MSACPARTSQGFKTPVFLTHIAIEQLNPFLAGPSRPLANRLLRILIVYKNFEIYPFSMAPAIRVVTRRKIEVRPAKSGCVAGFVFLTVLIFVTSQSPKRPVDTCVSSRSSQRCRGLRVVS